ncbi:PepSY domain-containing protein [Candidatus Nitrospira salsa]
MFVIRVLHRWIGIVLCLMFAAWFFSGAVLMYHPFPSLSSTERQAHRAVIDISRISQSPGKALQASGVPTPTRLRMIDRDGMPTYIVHSHAGSVIPLNAETGTKLPLITERVAGRIATAFYGQSAMNVEGPIEYDQWVVHQQFDPYRPFYRVVFTDRHSTVLYVSARTGEVLQKTQRQERAWNYVGAVLHWIYPTILRRHWALWDQVLWWMALFGVMTTMAGLWLGVWRLRQMKKVANAQGFSLFHGWLRGHHILGLFAGGFVLPWIVSGWLSMDHGRIFSIPIPTSPQVESFQGVTTEALASGFTSTSLQNLSDANAIEFLAVGGKPLIRVTGKTSLQLYEKLNSEDLRPLTLSRSEIVNAVQQAWPKSKVALVQSPESNDLYGRLRAGRLPQQTLRLKLDDSSQTWVHINRETGEIVSVMDQSRRIYRWLFNGLHSLDVPGLVERRPLWDIVMLFLLTVGFMFSVTGVVIGWRRVAHDWIS